MERRLSILISCGLLVVVMLSAAGCGGQNAAVSGIAAAPTATGFSLAEAAHTPALDLKRLDGTASQVTPAAAAAREAAKSTLNGSGFGPSESRVNTGRVAPPNYQSPLTAGQVDDNARFDDYLNYLYLRESQWLAAFRIAVEQRLFVRVLDGAQQPVAGARVQLFDGDRQVFDGMTVSDGRVLFFPREAGAEQASQLRAVVTRGQHRAEATLRTGGLEQTVTLDAQDNTGPVGLDIVFLIDATGSMADEIAQLKATVDSIAYRIEQMPGSSQPRLGLVAYRDVGEEYITRSWDFTSNVQQFSMNLSEVHANNGGDYPEAVNAGLREAIHLPGWADNSVGRRLRLIVLIGDAPPHLDYPNDIQYPQLLREAVAVGIKIFPIGASGLNDEGEYIFRQLAQVTQGQFVFLTYANGVSGDPGPATTHHVSEFTVRHLDSLIVNIVAGEVANQVGAQKSEMTTQVTAPVPVPSAPPQPSGLAGLVSATRDKLAGLVDGGTLVWAVLLLLVLLRARIATQRARVAPAALPASPPALAEADPGEDIVEEYAAERDWLLYTEEHVAAPRGQTLTPGVTRQVAPYEVYAYMGGNGQPTTPLRSFPSTYHYISEVEAVEEPGRQGDQPSSQAR